MCSPYKHSNADYPKFMTTGHQVEEMVTLFFCGCEVCPPQLLNSFPKAEISTSRAAKINERLLCSDKWPSQTRLTAKRHSRRSETLPSTPLSCRRGPPGHKRGEMRWGWEETCAISHPFFFFAEQNKKSCMVWLFKAMRCRLLPWSNSFRIVFSIHLLVTGKIEAPRRWHGAPGCPAVGLYSSGCKSSEHTLVWSLPPALSSSFSKVRCVLVRGCQSHFLVIVNHNTV